MDSVIHFENERFIGRTNFKKGLLNSLITLSVKDIEGVAHSQKVSVKFEFDGVVIDIWLLTKFGYSAADVIYRVQENVINTVSGMVSDKIKSVNVYIKGVE